jgi:hypothetical protein
MFGVVGRNVLVSKALTATVTGLMGEYIAAAAILSIGTHKVSLAQQDRIDLVAFTTDHFLRVQVKTATLHERQYRNASYQFQLAHGNKIKTIPNEKDFDIYALVAGNPQHRRCVFMPTKSVSQRTKRMSPSRFTVEAEIESWHKAVNYVLEIRR